MGKIKDRKIGLTEEQIRRIKEPMGVIIEKPKNSKGGCLSCLLAIIIVATILLQ